MEEDEDYDSDATVLLEDLDENPDIVARKRDRLEATYAKVEQTNNHATNHETDQNTSPISSYDTRIDGQTLKNNKTVESWVNSYCLDNLKPNEDTDGRNNYNFKDIKNMFTNMRHKLKVKREILKQEYDNNDIEQTMDNDVISISDDDNVVDEIEHQCTPKESVDELNNVIVNKVDENKTYARIRVLKPSIINARRATFDNFERNMTDSSTPNLNSATIENKVMPKIKVSKPSAINSRRATVTCAASHEDEFSYEIDRSIHDTNVLDKLSVENIKRPKIMLRLLKEKINEKAPEQNMTRALNKGGSFGDDYRKKDDSNLSSNVNHVTEGSHLQNVPSTSTSKSDTADNFIKSNINGFNCSSVSVDKHFRERQSRHESQAKTNINGNKSVSENNTMYTIENDFNNSTALERDKRDGKNPPDTNDNNITKTLGNEDLSTGASETRKSIKRLSEIDNSPTNSKRVRDDTNNIPEKHSRSSVVNNAAEFDNRDTEHMISNSLEKDTTCQENKTINVGQENTRTISTPLENHNVAMNTRKTNPQKTENKLQSVETCVFHTPSIPKSSDNSRKRVESVVRKVNCSTVRTEDMFLCEEISVNLEATRARVEQTNNRAGNHETNENAAPITSNNTLIDGQIIENNKTVESRVYSYGLDKLTPEKDTDGRNKDNQDDNKNMHTKMRDQLEIKRELLKQERDNYVIEQAIDDVISISDDDCVIDEIEHQRTPEEKVDTLKDVIVNQVDENQTNASIRVPKPSTINARRATVESLERNVTESSNSTIENEIIPRIKVSKPSAINTRRATVNCLESNDANFVKEIEHQRTSEERYDVIVNQVDQKNTKAKIEVPYVIHARKAALDSFENEADRIGDDNRKKDDLNSFCYNNHVTNRNHLNNVLDLHIMPSTSNSNTSDVVIKSNLNVSNCSSVNLGKREGKLMYKMKAESNRTGNKKVCGNENTTMDTIENGLIKSTAVTLELERGRNNASNKKDKRCRSDANDSKITKNLGSKVWSTNAHEPKKAIKRLSKDDKSTTDSKRARNDANNVLEGDPGSNAVTNAEKIDFTDTEHMILNSLEKDSHETRQKNHDNADMLINEQDKHKTSNEKSINKENVRDGMYDEGNQVDTEREIERVIKFQVGFCTLIKENLKEKCQKYVLGTEKTNAFLMSANLLANEVENLKTLTNTDFKFDCPLCASVTTFSANMHDNNSQNHEDRNKKCHLCCGFKLIYKSKIKVFLEIQSNNKDNTQTNQPNQNIYNERAQENTQTVTTICKNDNAAVNSVNGNNENETVEKPLSADTSVIDMPSTSKNSEDSSKRVKSVVTKVTSTDKGLNGGKPPLNMPSTFNNNVDRNNAVGCIPAKDITPSTKVEDSLRSQDISVKHARKYRIEATSDAISSKSKNSDLKHGPKNMTIKANLSTTESRDNEELCLRAVDKHLSQRISDINMLSKSKTNDDSSHIIAHVTNKANLLTEKAGDKHLSEYVTSVGQRYVVRTSDLNMPSTSKGDDNPNHGVLSKVKRTGNGENNRQVQEEIIKAADKKHISESSAANIPSFFKNIDVSNHGLKNCPTILTTSTAAKVAIGETSILNIPVISKNDESIRRTVTDCASIKDNSTVADGNRRKNESILPIPSLEKRSLVINMPSKSNNKDDDDLNTIDDFNAQMNEQNVRASDRLQRKEVSVTTVNKGPHEETDINMPSASKSNNDTDQNHRIVSVLPEPSTLVRSITKAGSSEQNLYPHNKRRSDDDESPTKRIKADDINEINKNKNKNTLSNRETEESEEIVATDSRLYIEKHVSIPNVYLVTENKSKKKQEAIHINSQPLLCARNKKQENDNHISNVAKVTGDSSKIHQQAGIGSSNLGTKSSSNETDNLHLTPPINSTNLKHTGKGQNSKKNVTGGEMNGAANVAKASQKTSKASQDTTNLDREKNSSGETQGCRASDGEESDDESETSEEEDDVTDDENNKSQANEANLRVLNSLEELSTRIKTTMNTTKDKPVESVKKTIITSGSTVKKKKNKKNLKPEILYVCEKCSCIFTYHSRYLDHMKNDHSVTDIKTPENCKIRLCPYCHVELNQKSFNSHIKRKHPNKYLEKESKGNVVNPNISTSKINTGQDGKGAQGDKSSKNKRNYEFKCIICKDTFYSFYAARSHIEDNHPDLMYKELCEKILINTKNGRHDIINSKSYKVNNNTPNDEGEDKTSDSDEDAGQEHIEDDNDEGVSGGIERNGSDQANQWNRNKEGNMSELQKGKNYKPKIANSKNKSIGSENNNTDSDEKEPRSAKSHKSEVHSVIETDHNRTNLSNLKDEQKSTKKSSDSEREEICIDVIQQDGLNKNPTESNSTLHKDNKENNKQNEVFNDEKEKTRNYYYKCKLCYQICNSDYVRRKHRKTKHMEMKNKKLFDKILVTDALNRAHDVLDIQAESHDDKDEYDKQNKSGDEDSRESVLHDEDTSSVGENVSKEHDDKPNQENERINCKDHDTHLIDEHYVDKEREIFNKISRIDSNLSCDESRIDKNKRNEGDSDDENYTARRLTGFNKGFSHNEIKNRIVFDGSIGNENLREDEKATENETASSVWRSKEREDHKRNDKRICNNNQKTGEEASCNESGDENKTNIDADDDDANNSNCNIVNMQMTEDDYVFKCQECEHMTKTYDNVIQHCQNHYTLNDLHVNSLEHNYNEKNNKMIRYSYKSLFKDWGKIFDGIPLYIAEDIKARSIYKTFCVKMSIIEDGPWKHSLYQCGLCATCVPPQEIEFHCQEKCYFISYPCSLAACNISFTTNAARDDHENKHADAFRLVAFNNKRDKEFNSTLFKVRKTQQQESIDIEQQHSAATQQQDLNTQQEEYIDTQPELLDSLQENDNTQLQKHIDNEQQETSKSNQENIEIQQHYFESQQQDVDLQQQDLDPQRKVVDHQQKDVDPQQQKIDPQQQNINPQRQNNTNITPQANIYKCQCGLCFMAFKNFKKHFIDCNFKTDLGVQCRKCAVPRLFENDELEDHMALHNEKIKYEFKVHRVIVKLDLEENQSETRT